MVPYADEELKALLMAQVLRDEQAVLAQLARLGSVSAQTIALLQLTRETAEEASHVLRHETRIAWRYGAPRVSRS